MDTKKQFELNCYGDKPKVISAGFGIDIGSQRLDDLDRSCLKFALDSTCSSRNAVDLGAGLGAQSARLAHLGWHVDWIDICDLSEKVSAINNTLDSERIAFHCTDVRALNYNQIAQDIRIIFSQRFIQYLSYQEAVVCLSALKKRVVDGCRMYLSAGGLNSELSNGYSGIHERLEDRFACLSEGMAAKHCIHAPLCLYSIAELEKLGQASGFKPIKLWTSEFGNVKGEFEV